MTQAAMRRPLPRGDTQGGGDNCRWLRTRQPRDVPSWQAVRRSGRAAGAVLVAIDISKLRNDVLIEVPGTVRRKRVIVINRRAERRRLSVGHGRASPKCGFDTFTLETCGPALTTRQSCDPLQVLRASVEPVPDRKHAWLPSPRRCPAWVEPTRNLCFQPHQPLSAPAPVGIALAVARRASHRRRILPSFRSPGGGTGYALELVHRALRAVACRRRGATGLDRLWRASGSQRASNLKPARDSSCQVSSCTARCWAGRGGCCTTSRPSSSST